MSYGSKVLNAGIYRTLTIQLVLIVITVLAFLVLKDAQHAFGAAFGGVIALAIAALLGWRLQRAANFGAEDEKQMGSAQLAIGAIERFIVVGIGFGVGIAVLKLPPVAMITAFAAAQLSFLMRVPTRLEQHKKRGVAP